MSYTRQHNVVEEAKSLELEWFSSGQSSGITMDLWMYDLLHVRSVDADRLAQEQHNCAQLKPYFELAK